MEPEVLTFAWCYVARFMISSTDLLAETEGLDRVQYIAFRVDGCATDGEAVIVDSRIGISWGADGVWGDLRNADEDPEAAIRDYLNDFSAWEARN